MIMVRFFLCVIGGIGLWWFFLPFINRRILNIGNLTGIAVCATVLLIGLFFPKILTVIKEVFSGGPLGKMLMVTALALPMAFVILTIVLSVKIYMGARAAAGKNATVVVLGCRVYGRTPSLMLRERLDAAHAYLLENPDSTCVVSGGRGEGEEISEAEAMVTYLVEKGIEEERLYKEDRSTNTRENLLLSYEIIRKEGLNKNIAIATNEFHEYRARKIAKNLSLEAGAIPGKTAWWLFPTFFVRELYSILYEWIR